MYSLLVLTLSLSGIMNSIVTIINFPDVLEEIRSSIKKIVAKHQFYATTHWNFKLSCVLHDAPEEIEMKINLD